jgi:thiol-disulfide isomerase/thioredoxin
VGAVTPEPPAGTSPGAARSASSRRLTRLVRVAVVATIVALVGVVGLAVSAAGHHSSANGTVLPPASSTLGNGERAPIRFTLARLGGGSAIDLAKLLHGRPAVVNFFASWCTQCAAELDAFGQAWRSDRGKVVFLGIDTNDYDKSKALAMLRTAGAGYSVAVDTSSDLVTNAYGANGLPTTFFVDAHGRVRFEVLGAQGLGALERRVNSLVEGTSPS